jgi:hypothetical protein
VKLPEVMTAMEALDVIKTKMARSNVVIVASWAHERTVCVFITAGPITKLCAWGEEESGGHVL